MQLLYEKKSSGERLELELELELERELELELLEYDFNGRRNRL